MLAVFRKEINIFFSSLIGYIAIGVFLVATSVFLFVLPQFNVLKGGYATLDEFFGLAPYVFWFLIPALTMRMFAEERRAGTIEILVTKPLREMDIVLGKYLAGLVLVLFSLVPTLIYYYTIRQLAINPSDIDSGATFGSYMGLFFLGAVYLAIGLFSSALTDNQIVAFIVALLLCFFFFALLDLLAALPAMKSYAGLLDTFSLQTHYTSISRGIVDTRDVVFFLSFIAAFLFGTKTLLGSRKW